MNQDDPHHGCHQAPWAAGVLRSVMGRAGRSLWRQAAALGLVATFGGAAVAAPQVFTGRIDHPNNTALVGSDLGPASFANPFDTANNVALHTFTITTGGHYDLTSTGVAAGGVDPYVTIFSGLGAGATFFASNFDNAFSLGGDFTLPLLLAAGDYTLAVGAFANMSFAENLGTGTLGDGFTGLGTPASLDDGPYVITIDVGTGPQPVPEPSMPALGLAALAAVTAARRRRARGASGASALKAARAWLAPITAAVLAVTAGPVFAQRAALVQNIDDSLRNPYQEVKSMLCSVSCTLEFSKVPPGRRRVVENVSCRTTSTSPIAEVALLANPDHSGRVFIPVERSLTGGVFYYARLATQYFYAAGEAPLVTSVGEAPVGSLWCTLSGREIAVP